MSSLNLVILIGNLGKNPELLKESEPGSFVSLSL
jgi:single-stranded DNA-binding protein